MKVLLTDCAKNFKSNTIKQFCAKNKIKHVFATPYHPQTCGTVERVNGTLITKLGAALLDRPNRKWSQLLHNIIESYNHTPHDVTGYTPQFLFFGHEDKPSFASPGIPIESARQLANERTENERKRRKEYHDKKHPDKEFQIGSKVLRRIADNHPDLTKLNQRWSGPYYVIAKIGSLTHDIAETLTSTPSRAHVSQLKQFLPQAQIQLAGANVTVGKASPSERSLSTTT